MKEVVDPIGATVARASFYFIALWGFGVVLVAILWTPFSFGVSYFIAAPFAACGCYSLSFILWWEQEVKAVSKLRFFHRTFFRTFTALVGTACMLAFISEAYRLS